MAISSESAAAIDARIALAEAPVAIYRPEPGDYLGIKGSGITENGRTFFVLDGDQPPSDRDLRHARIVQNDKPVNGALSAPHKVYLDPTFVCPCTCEAMCSANVPAIRRAAKAGGPKIPQLNEEDALLLADDMVRSGVIQSKIAGGDPFAWKPLPTVVERLGQGGIGLSLSTSGYNLAGLKPEIIDLLKRYGMKISVSLDGPPKFHDAQRQFPGLYGKALRGVQHLLEHGYPKKKLEIRATIADTDQSVQHALHIDELAKSTGLRTRIRMSRPVGGALANGNGHLKSDERYWALFKILRKLRRGNALLNFDDPVMFDDDNHGMVFQTGLDCGAGTRSMGIGARGDMSPCSYIDNYFPPVNVIQRVRQGGSLLDIWRGEADGAEAFSGVRRFHTRRARMLPCVSCGFKHGCQGGCPAYGLAVSKDAMKPVRDPRCPSAFIARGGKIE